jgi:hypothetical protein
MGRSYRGIDWVDRDEQLQPEFFSEATPIFLEETAASELHISVSGNETQGATEEIEAPSVAVRFDCDGFAEEVDDEQAQEAEPLEPMPGKVGASEWGSAFAEIHTRAHNLENHSKVTAIRYIQSGSTKKVSCLPSTVDFLADVQIVARKVLSPALYKLWKKVYYEDFGKNADRLPESVQMAIQQRCGTAWKIAGLLPFHAYWHIRTKPEKLCAVSLVLLEDKNDARNKRRRAARKARPVISTLTVAA